MSEEQFCCWRPKEVNTRTHFCLGHEPYLFSTSYNKDYNWKAIRSYTSQTLPPLSSKKSVGKKEKTRISFGNDAAVRTTTYQQVSGDSCYQTPVKAVSPPIEAKVGDQCNYIHRMHPVDTWFRRSLRPRRHLCLA